MTKHDADYRPETGAIPTERNRAGRFLPGSTGNPHGRPRAGDALSEAIREDVPPRALIALCHDIITNTGEPTRMRLRAAELLATWGYSKPRESHELVMASPQPEPDLTGLSDEQLRRLLALDAERDAILAAPQVAEPDEVEGQTALTTAPARHDADQ